ncbi:MAG: hypothetical protein GF353_30265 [Candidatus Lokiarchaeota archaeon]|nr:hypothetical protein [Candidatus Lokiarchaeota archaeon]
MASPTYAKSVVRKWYKEFPNSDLFKALPPGYQKNAKWTVELFAELMAGYMDATPSNWDGEDVYEVVVQIIPRKSIFDKETFEGFCPILRAFFEYLGCEIIEKSWSEELISSLKDKDQELLKNAKLVLD